MPETQKIKSVEKTESIQVEIVKEWNQPDILAVDKENLNPENSQRWIAKRKGNWDRKKQEGYVPVEGVEELHDLKLCEIPKKVVESRKRFHEIKDLKRESAISTEFEGQGRKLGVRTFDIEQERKKKYYSTPR